jgi:transcriptional regulator with XRE-family HTH domain
MPTETAAAPPVEPAPEPAGGRTAVNRRRQRALYGAPLGDRVRRLTTTLGITQARLAHTLGLSPAMLSQLASARRVKIGDPAVLARLQLLDRRCGTGPPPGRAAVDALLDEVARARLQWTAGDAPVGDAPVGDGAAGDGRPAAAPAGRRGPDDAAPREARRTSPAEALRAVAPPARLAAAAAALAGPFPELAEVLRQAAGHPAPRPGGRVGR